VVEFAEVTEFVDDDVIGEACGQQGDAVIEIQVSLFTATSPAGFLVFNADTTNLKMIKLVKIFQPAFRQSQRHFFVGNILHAASFFAFAAHCPDASPDYFKFHMVMIHENSPPENQRAIDFKHLLKFAEIRTKYFGLGIF